MTTLAEKAKNELKEEFIRNVMGRAESVELQMQNRCRTANIDEETKNNCIIRPEAFVEAWHKTGWLPEDMNAGERSMVIAELQNLVGSEELGKFLIKVMLYESDETRVHAFAVSELFHEVLEETLRW